MDVLTSVLSAHLPRRHPVTTPGAIAAWRERTRFRLELRRIARDNPHLIDDIGLTKKEVEAEIAKLPFWQR